MNKKTLTIYVIMLLIITGLSSIAVADDWPMYHHDLVNTGYSTSTAPEEHMLIWHYEKQGSRFSSPVVSDGKVYVGSDDWRLYCLDADDGTEIWNYVTWDTVISTPAVSDGKVYFGSNGGGVFCLDAYDGSLIWSFQTGFEFSSSPKVYDEKVYIGSEIGKLYCLDANTGNQIWVVRIGDCILGAPAIYNDKVYAGSWLQDEFFCLNANNGNIIWTFTADTSMHSSPVVVDGKVYVGSNILYCLNANTGSEIWNHQIKISGKKGGIGEYACPAIVDEKIYFGSHNSTFEIGSIQCLDADDGSKIWEHPTEVGMDSAPAIVENNLYINVWDGKLYCLDIDDGSLIWQGDGVSGSPAVVNNRIYNGGHQVFCYGDDTGNQPPNTPTIDGPPSGNKEVEYWYSFNATDPNGNEIWYSIDWGDDYIEEWIGPREPGMKISMNHTWYSQETFQIKVKVKDVFDEESDYATLSVSIPKNKATIKTPLFIELIENYPLLYKILQIFLKI